MHANGDVEAAKEAIDNGANVDVLDQKGLFPLFYAAHPVCGNNLKIVQMLIDAGCDVNLATGGHMIALNQVVFNGGNVSIVEALLRGGANPNIAHNNGDTPCHYAKTVEMLELLLTFGGDLRKKNSNGETPFQLRRQKDGNNVDLFRPIYEAWTPHQLLPRWDVSVFHLYIEGSSAFGNAIITLLLCLRRYRHMIPKEVGMEVLEYVAEMHRKEMWWPACHDFDIRDYM